MNMNKNEMEAAENLFEAMGLDDGLFREFADTYVQNFTIQADETEDLREILHKAPDSVIDLIWENLAREANPGRVRRKEKEQILYRGIQEYFAEQMIVMDPLQLKLLIRMINYEPISLEETLDVRAHFIPYGLAFMFYDDGNCSFVVPDELRDIASGLIKEPEAQEKMEFAFFVRTIVNTCLGLYGVFQIGQMLDIFRNILEDGAEQINGDFEQRIRNLVSVFEEQGLLWQDGEYIVSPYFESEEDYKELLRSRKEGYYLPEPELIQAYTYGVLLEKNKEYEAVLKLLAREIKDREQAEDMLERIYGYVVRQDWELPDVFNCLYSWEVAFDNVRTAGQMQEAVNEWLYTIHRWIECGYSRKGLHKENRNAKYLKSVKSQKEFGKKIYPNDPCPCGSGKKYKKCCGRK